MDAEFTFELLNTFICNTNLFDVPGHEPEPLDDDGGVDEEKVHLEESEQRLRKRK